MVDLPASSALWRSRFAGAVAIPFILLGAFIWLVTFPIRLLFKLIGGIFGMVFGLARWR